MLSIPFSIQAQQGNFKACNKSVSIKVDTSSRTSVFAENKQFDLKSNLIASNEYQPKTFTANNITETSLYKGSSTALVFKRYQTDGLGNCIS